MAKKTPATTATTATTDVTASPPVSAPKRMRQTRHMENMGHFKDMLEAQRLPTREDLAREEARQELRDIARAFGCDENGAVLEESSRHLESVQGLERQEIFERLERQMFERDDRQQRRYLAHAFGFNEDDTEVEE